MRASEACLACDETDTYFPSYASRTASDEERISEAAVAAETLMSHAG